MPNETKTVREVLSDVMRDFLTVRSAITLGAFFTLYHFVWLGKDVPAIIAHIVDILLGFWFGSKIAGQIKQKGEV